MIGFSSIAAKTPQATERKGCEVEILRVGTNTELKGDTQRDAASMDERVSVVQVSESGGKLDGFGCALSAGSFVLFGGGAHAHPSCER